MTVYDAIVFDNDGVIVEPRRHHCVAVELSVEPTCEVEDLHAPAEIANGR